jgi:hypothetical protein
MLMFPPKSDVQKLREYFVQIKDRWPEDYIEVEEAIQLFVEYEKLIIRERDYFKKEWEESFNYRLPQPILVRKEVCDPAALVGNWISYNSEYNLTKPVL